MAIFTDGESTYIDSPRHLTLRHAVRAVKQKKQEAGKIDKDEKLLPDLFPGQEKLNSFWAPALEAGHTHRITVSQTVDPKSHENPLQLDSQKEFSVDAPRFSLPAGSVHSVYPPAAYSEDHRILPHIVLTDPHLPWERLGSPKDPRKHTDRNRVPWLALLVFTQDELRLPASDIDGDKNIFAKTSGRLVKPVKQTSTFAVHMSLSDLLATNDNAIFPINEDQMKPGEDVAGDFIFIKPDLFTSLFSPFDSSNQRVSVPSPDVSQYKFLSHVRKINTTGMAVAGVEDIGIFSIVIANRSGPLDNLKSTTASVHLVSLEGIEDMRFPIDKRYVTLASLHSWNYTVMPPNMLNIPDTFESLGANLGLLRPSDDLINEVRSNATTGNKDMSSRLASRLEDGYSLVRYRTQTGETTAALFRGPFTPTVVSRRWTASEDSYSEAAEENHLGRCSNSGLDLQVLDKEVGIMDITYSAAWQLGRMLALADQVFTAALVRLRAAIHHSALKESKIAVVRKESKSNFMTPEDLLRDLPMMGKSLNTIPLAEGKPTLDFTPGNPLKRWHRPHLHADEFLSLRFWAEGIQKEYYDAAVKAAENLAGATDGQIYNETNDPVSTDWMIVLAWIMDKMFLHGVPAHYLITDPSHLEHERLQFFYIDPNWTDAMIDGALSLGNHLGKDVDRVAIKKALNRYIDGKILEHPPQIPKYGFYLRSDLVSMFPDLKVTTLPEPENYPPERAPLLRHEIITDGVMLALLDRIPGSDKFNGLVFTQPPHQQRFAAARSLETDHITVKIRRQYTVSQADRETDSNWRLALDVPDLPSKANDPDNIFIWGSKPGLNDLHILRLPRYADVQLNALVEKMGSFEKEKGAEKTKYFDDDTATSALIALQLNDPIYSLTINLASVNAQAALEQLSSTDNTSRTLELLQPPEINRTTTDFSLYDERPEGSESQTKINVEAYERILTETATSDRDSNLSSPPHAPYSSSTVPHTAPVPLETAGPLSSSIETQRSIPKLTMSTGGSDPAGSPKYQCKIYSFGAEVILVDEDDLPQDLIFSVLVPNHYSSIYKITKFCISIDLGEESPECHMLMANYEGPGPRMLSNLRFNVFPRFVKYPDRANTLELTLLPRSARGYVAIPLVREMSFILGLAQVNRPTGTAQLYVRTEAFYHKFNKSEKNDFQVTIVNKS